jgi:hypothetical protein
MSITRHEIRQISDENRGEPIISQAVVHGNVAYCFFFASQHRVLFLDAVPGWPHRLRSTPHKAPLWQPEPRQSRVFLKHSHTPQILAGGAKLLIFGHRAGLAKKPRVLARPITTRLFF